MNIPEILGRRTDYSQSVPKEGGGQWIEMSVPFVTQWLDAIRPDHVDPELFDKLAQSSHLAAIDGDPVEHKYVKTQSVRRNSRDHSGLIPNLLDVAETPEQALEILTDIVTHSVESLKEDGIYNLRNLLGFLAEMPLASWEFKGGENIGDFVNGAIASDLLHSRIVRSCKALRGPKSDEFYGRTNELFRQYHHDNAGEITYFPAYYNQEIKPKHVLRRLFYVKQHIHIFPVIHSSELDRLTPDVLTKEHEPLPDIEDPLWILHNSGKAGHPLSFVIAQSLKKLHYISDRHAHIDVQTDALDEWIRNRQ